MSTDVTIPQLTAKDYASDQDVRWCPGCGDYSILAQVKKVLPGLGLPKEKYVFVSGIGCASRFQVTSRTSQVFTASAGTWNLELETWSGSFQGASRFHPAIGLAVISNQ